MNLDQSPFGLEDIIINSELDRPSRAPNYEAENQALLAPGAKTRRDPQYDLAKACGNGFATLPRRHRGDQSLRATERWGGVPMGGRDGSL